MYILRLEVKRHVSALYGHHQVFLFPLRFRYTNCDVEISHPIIILVGQCIGGYYIALIYIYIYIYIYILSVGWGGYILRVAAGCQPPLLQGVAVTRLSMVGLAGTVSPVGEHKL